MFIQHKSFSCRAFCTVRSVKEHNSFRFILWCERNRSKRRTKFLNSWCPFYLLFIFASLSLLSLSFALSVSQPVLVALDSSCIPKTARKSLIEMHENQGETNKIDRQACHLPILSLLLVWSIDANWTMPFTLYSSVISHFTLSTNKQPTRLFWFHSAFPMRFPCNIHASL